MWARVYERLCGKDWKDLSFSKKALVSLKTLIRMTCHWPRHKPR